MEILPQDAKRAVARGLMSAWPGLSAAKPRTSSRGFEDSAPATRPLIGFAALLGLLFLSGCVHDGKLVHWAMKAPTAKVTQVVSTWNREVVFLPDIVHGGASAPGLVGRMYLFGGEDVGCPLLGDGALTVILYDDSDVPHGGESKQLEAWHYKNPELKLLLKRDIVGWGYSMFLPWSTYRPDLTSIHFKLCYQPAKGLPIYKDSGPITLDSPNCLPPAGGQDAAAKKPGQQQTAMNAPVPGPQLPPAPAAAPPRNRSTH